MNQNQIVIIVGIIVVGFVCIVAGGIGAYLFLQQGNNPALAEVIEPSSPTEPATAETVVEPTAAPTEPSLPATATSQPSPTATAVVEAEAEPTAAPTEPALPTEAPAAVEQDSPGNVITWSGENQPIAYGDTAQGTIAQIGDRHTYVFEAQAGEYVTALLDGEEDLQLYLISSDGRGLDCRTYSTICQLDNIELSEAGQYTLMVDGYESDVGDYTLHLTKLDETARLIEYGQTIEETMTLVGNRHTYVFEGQAGERVTALLDGEGDFDFYIIAPDDRGWDCRTYSGECQFDTGELPVTGEYIVIVDGYEDDIGDYSLTLVKNSG